MKKITKLMLIFLVFTIFISSPGTSFADNYEVIESEEKTVQEVFIPEDVELSRDKDGNFSGSFNITDAKAVPIANVTYKLQRDAGYQNLYSVSYSIASNSLINGFRANIKVKNTSLLNSQTYFNQNVNRTFTSTTFYAASAGTVIIPYEVKKVKIQARNTLIRFTSSGWKSAINWDGTYKVN